MVWHCHWLWIEWRGKTTPRKETLGTGCGWWIHVYTIFYYKSNCGCGLSITSWSHKSFTDLLESPLFFSNRAGGCCNFMVYFGSDHEGTAPRVGIQTQLTMAISPLSEDVATFVRLAVPNFADCGVGYAIPTATRAMYPIYWHNTDWSKNCVGLDSKLDTNKLFQGDLLICITLRIATIACTAQIRVANPTSLSLSLSSRGDLHITQGESRPISFS